MKIRRFVYFLSLAALCSGQIADSRLAEIKAKHDRGEKVTLEEQDLWSSSVERQNQENSAKRNADYARQNPARESTGLVPLPDLGKGLYKGEQGGLYPGGANVPPSAHLQAGLRLAREITPLDRDGRKSPEGLIVLLSIGMSNTTQESRSFRDIEKADKELNSKMLFVDGAEGAQTAKIIADPAARYWGTVDARLKAVEATAVQVQAVWLKEADAAPKEPFPAEVKKMQAELVNILHILHDKFPNLKIAYLSSRIYGGWAASPLNPEPHAYEEGFAVKWAIAEQIAGKPELNYDAAKGAVQSPWIAWGPYLWADGLQGRKDGKVTWKREDLGPDGTHPSMLGRVKVAHLLMDFLKKDQTSRSWFMK
jgi:hypothetical protein